MCALAGQNAPCKWQRYFLVQTDVKALARNGRTTICARNARSATTTMEYALDGEAHDAHSHPRHSIRRPRCAPGD